MNKKEQYPEDTDMTQFEHLPQISWYNHNYYVGFNQDLLFGESDDDNTTEWYVINANWGATKLCYSYCSEGDKLIH